MIEVKLSDELPIYEALITASNEDTGCEVVSLVDRPAIEENWFAFSDDSIEFAEVDKQILAGPLMIPDLLIYRKDQEHGEYHIKFSAASIELMAERFNRSLRAGEITIQHSGKKVSAFVRANWITGDPDKSSQFGFSVPVGTWFCEIKIEDEDFWNTHVKSGKLKGFSIEVRADVAPVNKTMKNEMKEKFAEAKLKDGTAINVSAVEVGGAVEVYDAESESFVPAPDGEHTLEDGTVIVTAGGKITEVKAASDMAEEPAAPEAEAAPETNVEELVRQAVEAKAQLLEERIAAIEEAVRSMNTADEELKSENEKLKSQVEEFSRTPGAERTRASATEPAKRFSLSEQLDVIKGLTRKM